MKKFLITAALICALLLASCEVAPSESSESTTITKTTEESHSTQTEGSSSALPKETAEQETSSTVAETTGSETTEAATSYLQTTAPETEETVLRQDTSETENETEKEPETDTGYLKVNCREPEDYYTQLFALTDEIDALSLELPDDWSFEKRTETDFEIKRDGSRIGKLTYGSRCESDHWENLTVKRAVAGSVTMEANIEKNIASGEYRHRICFDCEKDGETVTYTLVADYAELSENAIAKLRLYLRYKSIGTKPELGMIDVKNNSDDVLILGNSFIRTSQVGAILQEMMNKCGKTSQVTHVSRGYAHVDTYAYDEEIMENIRNGAYGAVFICGFHNNEQAEHLAVMKEACDASKTALVIFPAHNEQPTSIKYAMKNVEGVYLLHWKDEIQSFIDCGGDKWDFCIDDAHLHSTPLAGYIGAHMIYRSIFGELPDCSLSETISREYVDSILGNYSKTGITYKYKTATLNFFGK